MRKSYEYEKGEEEGKIVRPKKSLVAFLWAKSGKRWTFARLFRRIAQIF